MENLSVSILSLTGAAARNDPFQTAATSLRRRMFHPGPGGRRQDNPDSEKTPVSIHSLARAALRNGPFHIAATSLRSRMFRPQRRCPVPGVAPVQRRRLGHPPHRV